MKSNVLLEKPKTEDSLGLTNLARNILIKKIQMGISLKEFSRVSDVSYNILNSIVNLEPIMPTLSTLNKLAKILNLKVADILQSGDLPQYVPKFNISEYKFIENYLNDKPVKINQFELSDKFISQLAYSVNIEIKILDKTIPAKIFLSETYAIEPNKILFIKNKNNKFQFYELIEDYKNQITVKEANFSNSDKKDKSIKLLLPEIKILGEVKKISFNYDLAI